MEEKGVIRQILNKVDKNLVFLIIITCVLMTVILLPGRFASDDILVHLYRIAGISQSIEDGQIPAKICYNVLNGYGYGWGIFYPNLSIVIPVLLKIIGFSVNKAYKIGILVATIASVVIMYKFLKYKFNNKFVATCGTMLYLYAPYKIVQAFMRGAISEMFVFIALPLVFWGLEKLLRKEKNGEYYIIIGACIIILSHVISTIYIAIFALIYLIFNIKKLDKQIILKLIKSIIFILLITSYFTIPLIENVANSQYKMFITEDLSPSEYTLYIPQLIWSSGEKIGTELPLDIGLIIISVMCIIPLVFKNIKKKKSFIIYLAFTIITIILMCSTLLWGKTAILDIIQFPWRLIVFTIFFGCICCSYIIEGLNIQTDKENFCILVLFIALIISIRPYIVDVISTQTSSEVAQDYEQYDIDKNNTKRSYYIGANDYLPAEMVIEEIADRGNQIKCIEGEIIENCELAKEKNTFKANIKINSEIKNKVELPLIYYVGYDIKINGEKVSYSKSDDGFIQIELPNEQNIEIQASYKGTVFSKIANIISLISFIGVIVLIIKNKRND